jgi:phosphoribosylamine---glycine ligase
MKVAIIGKNGFGGREHALAHTIKVQNPETELFLYPGNGGTGSLGLHCPALSLESIIEDCASRKMDLLIGGPEADFDQGLTDLARMKGLPTFGPTREASRIEGNKLFAKKVMEVFSVPTARYRFFPQGSFQDALNFMEERGFPLVLKANGLAAGKGVLVLEDEPQSFARAQEFLQELDQGGYLGAGQSGVLVEEKLKGEEASLLYLVNSAANILLPLKGAQDHKRIGEGDTGLNTGGMGAFSDNPLISDPLLEKVTKEIAEPVILGLQSMGIHYTGVLYLGLMIDQGSPSVIEINCRFGDPEIEAIVPRLETSLLHTLQAVTAGSKPLGLKWSSDQVVSVVLASKGYPGLYEKGKLIRGLENIPDKLTLYHGGTAIEDGKIVTSGGRVLNLVGRGASLQEARQRVYDFLDSGSLGFEGMIYRRDISYKADAMSQKLLAKT